MNNIETAKGIAQSRLATLVDRRKEVTIALTVLLAEAADLDQKIERLITALNS